MKRRLSLRRILAATWLIPGVIALALSAVAFFALGWFQYTHARRSVESDLERVSLVVARRLSSEVLLGQRGSADVIAAQLKREFSLEGIALTQAEACADGRDFCVAATGQRAVVLRRLPSVQNPTFARIESATHDYWSSLEPKLLLWSAMPILVLLGLAALCQRWALNRFVAMPVESLVSHVSSAAEPPGHWPKEYAKLSDELREALVKRDLALVGQISGGVIHDLNNLLHSTWAAASLAQEQAKGSEKRMSRLEGLARAVEINFPKMRSLIESTLDGAREIRLKVEARDLRVTLKGALESNQLLASRSGVAVECLESVAPIIAAHDPVQLERALTNLIKNGVEAAGEGEVKKVRIALSADAEGAAITVEDSGPGLGASPGAVLRSVRSTKIRGTGLGLVVSRKVIQAHGGRISADKSIELHGAKFAVWIPTERGLA